MGITVKAPGLLTTVQDEGRFGFQRMGVPTAGWMDGASAQLANLLCCNAPGEAVLECMMMGATLEFGETTGFALAGADFSPLLDGAPVPMYALLRAKAGSVLSFAGRRSGAIAYIAVCGGLDIKPVLGSRSTHIRSKLGGYEGRKLAAGDVLPFRTPHTIPNEPRALPLHPVFPDFVTLRVVEQNAEELFTKEGLNTFYNSEYAVSADCDRMGFRLTGAVVEHKNGADIITDGIAMGSVQVPSAGTPIIMMADHQTTGGYTKIGCVIRCDLPKLAQSVAGTKIRFKMISVQDAQAELVRTVSQFDALAKQFPQMKGANR